MNIYELERKLKTANVPAGCYSIMKGGLPNEVCCLISENGNWVVYYSERGKRSGETVFKSESEACAYFYDKLKKYAEKRPKC